MEHFNRYSAEYIKQISDNEFETVLITIRRNQVCKQISKFKHDQILEIGCGLDPLFSHISDYRHFVTIEPVSHFYQAAVTAAGNNPNISVIHDTLEDALVELKKRPFDFIVSSSILHEVPDPFLFLKSLFDICSRDTVVYLDVPNIQSFHRLLGLEMGLISNLAEASTLERRFGRYHHFGKAELIKIIADADFELIDSFTYFLKPFPNDQMAEMLRQNIINEVTLNALEDLCRFFPDNGSGLAVLIRRKK